MLKVTSVSYSHIDCTDVNRFIVTEAAVPSWGCLPLCQLFSSLAPTLQARHDPSKFPDRYFAQLYYEYEDDLLPQRPTQTRVKVQQSQEKTDIRSLKEKACAKSCFLW